MVGMFCFSDVMQNRKLEDDKSNVHKIFSSLTPIPRLMYLLIGIFPQPFILFIDKLEYCQIQAVVSSNMS